MSTRREQAAAEPWRFDFFALMRELERSAPDKPRIGQSAVAAQEIVTPGQDPFLEFPAANVTGFEPGANRRPARLRTRFLGYFGPQGALPLTTTIEAYHWMRARDPAFVRFSDLFATRFLQLFFRAWADARPVAQHDRPGEDRFKGYVGAALGIGTPALRHRDSVPDIAKLPYAGLLGSRVKSATRLRQALEGMLGVEVELVERVTCWLDFEESDLTRLGQPTARLGQTSYLGARVQSINDKATLRIRTDSLEEYRRFLPGGARFAMLRDLVTLYLGPQVEFDLELGLAADALPATRLGRSGELGWTGWAAPRKGAAGSYVWDARFSITGRAGAPEAA